jgi:pheromone shutdown protein TraB
MVMSSNIINIHHQKFDVIIVIGSGSQFLLERGKINGRTATPGSCWYSWPYAVQGWQ